MFSIAQLYRNFFLDTTNRNIPSLCNLINVTITLVDYHLEGGDIKW